MLCKYCGFEVESSSEACSRCGSPVVPTEIQALETSTSDEIDCPSCGQLNNGSAEYCAGCGSPMAIITRVLTLSRARVREPLDSWRVYGIETSMAGRRSELQIIMKAHQESTKNRRVQRVHVRGPTGLGKSRLISEFVRCLDDAMSETMIYQAEARDESAGPYVLIERMLRARFYIGDKEAPETTRRKLLEACAALVGDNDGERVAHFVGELMGISFEESKHLPSIRDTEDAAELDKKCVSALLELLIADAKANPLVLIFEDLQYAPNPVLNLLETLVIGLVEHPVLFVFCWNPDELPKAHPLRTIPECDHDVWLKPLSDLEVEHFVRDTLRKAPSLPTTLVERVTEAAHGNPLIVEEFLRILISQGIIDTRYEEWKVDERRVKEVELPATVEGAVEARLLALNDEERLVIGMCASIGQTFWAECLLAIIHVEDEQGAPESGYWADAAADSRIDAIIESLERKDMVRRSEEGPAGLTQLYFKHRIEQKSIYAKLSPKERERYHRLIAQWLQLNLGENPAFLEAIAEHFSRGNCLEHAAQAYKRAAAKAQERYDNIRAMHLLRRALASASDRMLELKLNAFRELGALLFMMGEHDEALETYREVLRYAWMLADRLHGASAYNEIGRAHRNLGDYEKALVNFEIALRLFRDADHLPGIATALDSIGHIHWVRGDFDEAKTFFTAGLHLRREENEPSLVAQSLSHIGSVLLQQGDLKGSMVYFRESLDLRKAVNDRHGVVDSFNNLGCLLLERGDEQGALTLLEEALETARSIGYRSSESIVLNNIGELHLQAHRTREAREYLDEAMSVAEDGGDRRVLFDILKNMAKLELRESNRDLALERVHEALEIANQLESNQLIGLGMLALGDVHAEGVFDPNLRDTSIALARSFYEDAVSMFEVVGNDAELAKSLAGLGRLIIETGDESGAQVHLQRATEIFTRLEMKEFARNTRLMFEDIPS